MFSSLLAFLGGSVFRMLWGEIGSWLTKAQDHSHEIERMRVQGELDAARHGRLLESIKQQADAGVKVIEAKAEAVVDEVSVKAWLEAVTATTRTVGVAWIDGWNAVIRPGVATWAVLMMTLAEFGVFVLSDNASSVCSAALGIYLAERNLLKRGK